MGAAVAPVLGLAGGLIGMDENRKNRNAAKDASDKANDLQREGLDITKGQIAKDDAWKALLNKIVTGADASGLWDADAQIKQLEHDSQRGEAMQLNNLGQTFSNMGFRPGDTVPTMSITGLAGQQASARDQMRVNLRRQTFFDKLGAYQALNPASGNQAASMAAASASQGANMALHQSQIAGSKIQNPANFLAGFMPFLGGRQGQGTPPINPSLSGDNTNLDMGQNPVSTPDGFYPYTPGF